MNKNLLIIGASTYGVVASEIAADMGCFEKIDFVDDERKITPNGIDVIGTTQDIDELAIQYSNIIVTIGNPEVRLSLLTELRKKLPIVLFRSFLLKHMYLHPHKSRVAVLLNQWRLYIQDAWCVLVASFLQELS